MVNINPFIICLALLFAGCAGLSPLEQQAYNDSLTSANGIESYERDHAPKNDGKLRPYCYPELSKTNVVTYYIGVKKAFYGPLDPKLKANAKKHWLKP